MISQHNAYPAAHVVTPNGSQFHFVGSIHMAIERVQLPPALLARLTLADAVIVEVDIAQPVLFDTTAVLPPLTQRLTGVEYQQLAQRLADAGTPLSQVETKPGWFVALLLQMAQANLLGLTSEFGIDRQIIEAAAAHAIPLIELDGAAHQLALLQQLPDNGMPLLRDTLNHWQENEQLLLQLLDCWLNAQPIDTILTLPYESDNKLYELLITQRNARWAQQLHALPKGDYVVVVGALHLVGQHSVVQQLKTGQPS